MPLNVNTSGSFVEGNGSGRFRMVGAASSLVSLPTLTVSGSVEAFSNRGLAGPITLRGAISSSYEGDFRGKWGGAQGIMMGPMDSYYGESDWGRPLQSGVTKNTISGTLGDSCLELREPGFWRFRWAVKSGARSISVQANQNSTGSLLRPSMVVKKNPSIGVMNDVSASAVDGSGWKTIGPIAINPTSLGYVWVELRNNGSYYPAMGYMTNGSGSGETSRVCLFDHIVTT